MALVRRNNNMQLIAKEAAGLAAVKIGQTMLSPAGRELVWNGINWVRNRLKRSKDVVQHPGAMPGSIAAPVAVTRVIRQSKPRTVNSKGFITIRHRELIGTFVNSVGLVVNGGVSGNIYRINPSNPTVFPWLQGIAASFDQYTFNKVELQFVPMCASTETGRVALYFDKDSQDAEPVDRVEVANMAHLVETAPWCEARLPIPVDSVKRFISDSSVSDPKLIDLGQIGVVTYGGSGGNTIGDVFIHYDVTLYEPQPLASIIETEQTGTGATPFGVNLVSVSTNSTTTTITFRGPGTYLVSMAQRSTAFTTTSTTNATVTSSTLLQNGTLAYMAIFNVTVTLPGGTVTMTGVGFGNYTINVVRAKVANNTNLL